MTGIFVDLDGVLWFSESAHKHAFKMALSSVLENATEIIDQTWDFGESTERYIKRLLGLSRINLSEPQIDELVAKKRNLAAEITNIPLNLLLIDSLKEMKGLDCSIGLVSSSSPSNVQKFLDSSNLHTFFDCVVDSSMVFLPKPDPGCYSLAMTTLGLIASECLAIEDSESGRVAAVSAGISRILIFPNDFSGQHFTDSLVSSLKRAN